MESQAIEEIDDLDFQSIQLADSETERELSDLDDLGIQVSAAPTTTSGTTARVDAYGSPVEEREAETRPGGVGIQFVKPPASGESSRPTDAYGSPISAAEEEEQWFFRTMGQQLGPMTWADLSIMARKGEIGLNDEVRRMDESEWQPARTIAGLLPEYHSAPAHESSVRMSVSQQSILDEDDFEMSNAMLSSRKTSSTRPPKKKSPSRTNRRPRPVRTGKTNAEFQPPAKSPSAAKPKAESKPEDLHEWLAEEVPPEPETPAETKPIVEESVAPPVETSNRAAEYQARIAALAREQAAKKPVAAKTKVQGPSMGERFSGLTEKLKENPKVMGVLAVLALVLIFKYVPWPFGKGAEGYLDPITQIGDGYKQLRTKKAPPAEFNQFKKEFLPAVKALISELREEVVGTHAGPKNELLTACGNLETMLSVPLQAKPTKTEILYDYNIDSAKALMAGKTPPPLPEAAKPKTEEP